MKANHISTAVLAAMILIGCSQEREDPLTPDAASDAQERFGQEGTNLFAQVATNAQQSDLDNIVQGQTALDKALAERIHVALSTATDGTQGTVAEEMLNQDIRVRVDHGVVVLEGEVRTEEEKRHFGDKVRGFEGVREVRNQLKVVKTSPIDSPAESMIPFQGNDAPDTPE